MFFLILLGRRCSEKNCAGFCRDLREFSRTVAGARLAGVAAAGRLAAKTGACPMVPPWPRDGCSNPVWQGFRERRAVTLTVEMHRVRIGRGRRMSTTPRPSGSRAHRSIAQRFEWRRGRDIHIRNRQAVRSGADAHRWHSQRGEWMSAVDIHILAGSFRRSAVHPHRSNTQGREWVCRADIRAGTRMRRDDRFALTVENHSASSGLGSRISTSGKIGRSIAEARSIEPRRAVSHAGSGLPPISRRHSPSKNTVPRVVSTAGYPH